MKTLIVIAFILIGIGIAQAHDHGSSELSDAQQVIRMFERDLGKEQNKIRALYNTIHSEAVSQEEKCQYTEDLAKSLTQFELGLNQYQQILFHYVNASFDPNVDPSTAMVKLIVVEQTTNEIRSMKEVLPIMQKNYCGTVL